MVLGLYLVIGEALKSEKTVLLDQFEKISEELVDGRYVP